MPTTKRKCCKKKTASIVKTSPIKKEVIKIEKKAKIIGKKIVAKFKKAHDAFDSLEPRRKKEILAGIIGATAIAVGVGSKIANSKRNN
ncbi:MAG: hypothetical protein WCV92_04240 [Candidatus Buchananbacteria bacterium]